MVFFYNYFQYEVKDAADAMGFLNDRAAEGLDYVEGLPCFGIGGKPFWKEFNGRIVFVLFKYREPQDTRFKKEG